MSESRHANQIVTVLPTIFSCFFFLFFELQATTRLSMLDENVVSNTLSRVQGITTLESTRLGDAVVMTTDLYSIGGLLQATSKVKTITTKSTIISSFLPSVVNYEASTTTQVSISTPLPRPQNCPTEGLWLISLNFY